MVFIDDLDYEMCDSGVCEFICSLPGNLFGSDEDDQKFFLNGQPHQTGP